MSTITVATIDLVNFQYSASAVYLRLYAESSFITSAGIPIQAGNPNGGSWYKQVTCTLVGTTLTLPQFTLDSTSDGLDITTAYYNAYFYDGNGRQLGQYAGFESFRVGSSPSSTTWSQIRAYNLTRVIANDYTAYTKAESDARYATTAQSLPSLGSANQVVGVNSGATATEYKSLASGTSGSDFAIAHSSGTITFNLPTASGSNRGALSSADWTTFNSKQAGDATLTALAAYNTNGILTQTAADTFTGRTVTGTSNQIDVSNGNGVSGNPTLSIPNSFTLPSASPTFTASTAALYDRGGLVYNLKSYIVDDGTTDNYDAINTLINTTIPATGAIIDISSVVNPICMGTTLVIGTGTGSAISSRHGVVIRGRSGHKMNMSGISTTSVTGFKWIGSDGGTMFDINGPISGVRFEHVYINGNALLATAIDAIGAEGIQLVDVKVEGHKSWAIKIDHYASGSIVVDMNDKSDKPYISHLTINSTNANSCGLQVAATSSISQLYMDNSRITLQGGSNVAIELGMTDNNVFSEVTTSATIGVKVKTVASTPQYPENQFFYGCAIIGGVTVDESAGTWAPVNNSGLFFSPYPTADSQSVPSDTRIWGLTDARSFFGADFKFSGNLRIATTGGGAYKLVVADSATAQIRAVSTGTPGTDSAGIHAGLSTFPTAADQRLAFYAFGATPTIDGSIANGALISGWSGDVWSAGVDTSAYLRFETTPVNSPTRAEVMRITPSGRVLMGTTTDNAADQLQVSGGALFTGTIKAGSSPTTLTDSAGKILSAALNTVAVAQGGSGTTTATGSAGSIVLSIAPTFGTSIASPIVYGGSAAGATLTLNGTSGTSAGAAHVLMNTVVSGAFQGTLGVGAPSTSFINSGSVDDLIHMQAGDGMLGLVTIDSYGTGVVSGLVFRSARNTAASPNATQAADSIASFGGRGYQDTSEAFATTNNAAVVFTAAENFTGTAQGMHIDMQTTPKTSTTRAQRWRFDAEGWLIGKEVSGNPTTSDLAAGDQVAIYKKADKLVFAHSVGGTINYLTIDLDGSDTTWAQGTSAP